jgi:long-chain acyl-CoA synthetase
MAESIPSNLAALLSRAAEAHGDKAAVIDGDRSLTWSELDDRAVRVATGLAAVGLVAGHRVGLALTNSIEFIAAYLGILRAGLVAVPVNPTSTTGELARVLVDSGSRVCLADESTIATVRASTADISDLIERPDPGQPSPPDVVPPLIVPVGVPALPGERPYDELTAATGKVVSPRDPESLAVLLYTSGTSGRPRGAMLSHRALLANVDQAARTEPAPVWPDDIVLGVLPLFHVYGLNAVFGQVLNVAATLVIGKRFDPDETLRLIASAGVTCVPVAPPVIVAWNERDDVRDKLASVRTLLSGAAPLPEDLVRSFEARTGVTVEQGYGLTEAAPIVTTTVGTPSHKPGSTGRAVPGVELRVVDDSGHDVEADDPGEILVRGANLFTGYWPDGDGGPDDDGWLATGDIGFLDGDGDLFMVDRLKELVIVSGFNVYPSEIEDVISEVDGVRECAVIGVPDERTGEAVVAYVVAADGVDPEALAGRVLDHCETRVARFKVPSAVQIVGELPHSATGKVAKGRLRASEARRAMGLL